MQTAYPSMSLVDLTRYIDNGHSQQYSEDRQEIIDNTFALLFKAAVQQHDVPLLQLVNALASAYISSQSTSDILEQQYSTQSNRLLSSVLGEPFSATISLLMTDVNKDADVSEAIATGSTTGAQENQACDQPENIRTTSLLDENSVVPVVDNTFTYPPLVKNYASENPAFSQLLGLSSAHHLLIDNNNDLYINPKLFVCLMMQRDHLLISAESVLPVLTGHLSNWLNQNHINPKKVVTRPDAQYIRTEDAVRFLFNFHTFLDELHHDYTIRTQPFNAEEMNVLTLWLLPKEHAQLQSTI